MSNKEEGMAMDNRWTIRRVSGEARKQIEELHMLTGIPYGRLVSEAIGVWYTQFRPSRTAHCLEDHFFWHAQNLTPKPVAWGAASWISVTGLTVTTGFASHDGEGRQTGWWRDHRRNARQRRGCAETGRSRGHYRTAGVDPKLPFMTAPADRRERGLEMHPSWLSPASGTA
jgi:hypothetical protein